ncbi:MoaD/ThiS family protein [Haloquadratum walsbyi]|jgi:ThiS family.|uniref:ThiS family n=1 Tax=Haloquadratum walsbyi J07HQW2 TaxID=1238425 RepID=U1PXR7_9EURY|nr:MoaD/ThiS family protein [Haloquadratum walsbyi]ERG97271.1 MAG: ThiS family [Haloquadratum walsbyi J07HQW2]
MATIKLPAALVGGSATSKVEVTGETVGELFDNHAAEHGDDLRDSVIEDGKIKEFINVYVDGTPVDELDSEVPDDAQVRVIPAASGGR